MSEFPNKNSFTEKRAKNVNEAVIAALDELGVTKDDVTVEIIDEGKKGIFGIGAREAVVRVTLKEGASAKNKPAASKAAEPKDKPEKKPDNSEVFKQPEMRHTASKQEKRKPAQQNAPAKKVDNSQVFKQPEVRHSKKKDAVKKDTVKKTAQTAAAPASPAPKPVIKQEERVWTKAQGELPELAVKFLSDVFKAMDAEISIEAKNDQDGNLLFTLAGDNMGIIIGKRGDTLDSLQYLVSLVVNRRSEDYIKVTLDTENYREKRNEALLALSQRLAAKVAKSGKRFTLEPMNPYERRIIHSSLQDSESVTTYSVGAEPYRRVVIAPKNTKPRYRKNAPKNKAPRRQPPKKAEKNVTAEKRGSYTTTYKADFKPQQHKPEYKSFEDYLAGHSED